MKVAESRRLTEVRRGIPERARQLGSIDAICAEILRTDPDLMAPLGESLLHKWVKEKLRGIKEPRPEMVGQLPMFGQFGDEVLLRKDWTPEHYQVYCRRHAEVAARNTAIMHVLADEYAERFGRPLIMAA